MHSSRSTLAIVVGREISMRERRRSWRSLLERRAYLEDPASLVGAVRDGARVRTAKHETGRVVTARFHRRQRSRALRTGDDLSASWVLRSYSSAARRCRENMRSFIAADLRSGGLRAGDSECGRSSGMRPAPDAARPFADRTTSSVHLGIILHPAPLLPLSGAASNGLPPSSAMRWLIKVVRKVGCSTTILLISPGAYQTLPTQQQRARHAVGIGNLRLARCKACSIAMIPTLVCSELQVWWADTMSW